MKFSEVLQRYHISPLVYADGISLSERDYADLFKIYLKYIEMKGRFDKIIKKEVEKSLIDKVDHLMKNSIIEPSESEVMDILMEQEDNQILENEK